LVNWVEVDPSVVKNPWPPAFDTLQFLTSLNMLPTKYIPWSRVPLTNKFEMLILFTVLPAWDTPGLGSIKHTPPAPVVKS